MKDIEFVILDIETTGLSRYVHKITEIAAVKFKGKKKIGEFYSLINPETPIPRFISKLTGIDNKMVKDAPTIDMVLPDFVKFLGDSLIVAHNATFDYGFISYNAYEHMNVMLLNERICTRKLASRLLPDIGSKKLGCVCEYLGIINENAHRAMSDVNATTQVFNHFLNLLSDKGFRDKNDVLRFESWPVSKCYRLFNSE